jgi:ubiquinone/menaquinone biosynthesis C-methylase UbiE
MGREIARTMHWQGGDWLLRTEREREEHTADMLAALGVQAGWTVADFGCGNGYHTLELARLSGPEGVVFGVEIQPEMLTMLETRAREGGLENVVSIRGTALSAPLPTGSCDLILLADVYHELSHPVPMLAEIRRALKPGGRVALLEFRAEDPEVPIKPLHKMTRGQVVAELEAGGFRADGEMDELPWQHLLFFQVAEQ